MPDYTADGIAVSYIDYPDSSFVRLVAYDDTTGELYVQLNDYVYVYGNVLEDVYHEFVNAASAGHYYDASVKGVFKSQYVGDKYDYAFQVRPVSPAPEPEVEKPSSLTLTDPGLDKSWFQVYYTVTERTGTTVIARDVEDAIRILKEDLENEGVENFVITSVTTTR